MDVATKYNPDTLQAFHDSLAPRNLSRMLWLLITSTLLSLALTGANLLSIKEQDFVVWQMLDIGGSLVFFFLFWLGRRGLISLGMRTALAPAYFAFWLILMDGYHFNALSHYGETATYALGTITPAILIILSPRIVASLLIPNHALFCYMVLNYHGHDGFSVEQKITAIANGSLGVIIAFLAAFYIYHAQRGIYLKERLVNERTFEARRAESNLRAILENIPFQAWLKDAGGTFLAVNREFAHGHGSSEKELVGKSTWEVYGQERAEEYIREDAEIFRSGERSYFEECVKEEDGSKRWYEVFKSPVIGDSGHCLGTAGVARDITERKEMEQRLIAADLAKSEFMAVMSHEIRTPMNSVLGYARLLQEMPLTELQQEYVSSINNSGHLLLSVINDILDFSKLEAGKISLQEEIFPLRQLVGRLLAMSEPLALEKKISLVLVVDAGLPDFIRVDPRRVEQLLTNLLSNAVKFTEYGSVTLNVSAIGAPSALDPWLLKLQVIDTGIGISADQRERLFKAFSQIDSAIARRFTGTGLGLVIVERLCSLMGGGIEVESELGNGSTFTATVRVMSATATEQAAASTLPTAGAEQRDISKARILVAEDNNTNRRLLAAILGRWGIVPNLVENGQRAIEEATTAAYDVILMDVQMPGLDGLDATRAIRRWEDKSGGDHRNYIVALTALAQTDDSTRCLEAGMDAYLMKPLNADSLRAIIAARVSG